MIIINKKGDKISPLRTDKIHGWQERQPADNSAYNPLWLTRIFIL